MATTGTYFNWFSNEIQIFVKNNILKSLSKGQGILIIGVAVFLLIIPSIIFMLNFWNQSTSDKISDWGSFGDFVGGLIGTVIGFINLLFLVFITYKLSDIDSNREIDNLRFQSFISLNELRNNSYKDVNHTIKLFISESIMSDSRSFEKLALYVTEVEAFCEGMSHLFPCLENEANYDEMLECMTIMVENNRQRRGELSQEQKSKYRNDTNIFIEKKDEFIGKIQFDIISNNPLKLLNNE